MEVSSTRDNVSVESMTSDMIADFVEGRQLPDRGRDSAWRRERSSARDQMATEGDLSRNSWKKDLKIAEKDALVKKHGYSVFNYHEN